MCVIYVQYVHYNYVSNCACLVQFTSVELLHVRRTVLCTDVMEGVRVFCG